MSDHPFLPDNDYPDDEPHWIEQDDYRPPLEPADPISMERLEAELQRLEGDQSQSYKRAPITPEFEEKFDPITENMVGSQAWGRQRVAAELDFEPTAFSMTRELLTSAKLIIGAGLAAILVATIFSYWTPDESLSPAFTSQMRVARNVSGSSLILDATALPTEEQILTIGIIAGHSGQPQDESFIQDPGAICDDNNDGIPELTELDINTAVARMVVNSLLEKGYTVELLTEFDERLLNYRGDALLSIHTNDCQNYGFGATGYNVAGPSARGTLRGTDEALVRCMIERYGQVTGLERHFGLTEDMTSYHTFREVSVDTPVAIIEIGFMFSDRQFLTQNQPLVAEGIIQGMLCFVDPTSYPLGTTPTPTPEIPPVDAAPSTAGEGN